MEHELKFLWQYNSVSKYRQDLCVDPGGGGSVKREVPTAAADSPGLVTEAVPVPCDRAEDIRLLAASATDEAGLPEPSNWAGGGHAKSRGYSAWQAWVH